MSDKAAAVKLYMQQAGESLEAQNAAAEIKLRAERRAGELLREMEKNKGGNPKLSTSDRMSLVEQPKLKDMGISKKQSSRWQQAASVPERVFEQHVAEAKAAAKPLTTSGVAKLVRDVRRWRAIARPDGLGVERRQRALKRKFGGRLQWGRTSKS